MAARRQTQNYLRTKVLTATPDRLLLLLFEGAIKFTEQGRMGVKNGEFESSNAAYQKAGRIVLELAAALRPGHLSGDVTDRLRALYLFVYERIVHANLKREDEPAEEALQILNHLLETWRLTVSSARENGDKDPSPARAAQTRGITALPNLNIIADSPTPRPAVGGSGFAAQA